MSFLCSYTKIYPGLEFGNELITIYYNKVFCLSLGDMDMKKMNSPKLEVIQFNTEDVIVTSGVGYKSLSPGRTYFSLGSEMDEAFPNQEMYRRNSFYKFYLDANSSEISYSTRAPFKINDIDPIDDYYAWYDLGKWFTEDKRKDAYFVSNDTYNWIRRNTN